MRSIIICLVLIFTVSFSFSGDWREEYNLFSQDEKAFKLGVLLGAYVADETDLTEFSDIYAKAVEVREYARREYIKRGQGPEKKIDKDITSE